MQKPWLFLLVLVGSCQSGSAPGENNPQPTKPLQGKENAPPPQTQAIPSNPASALQAPAARLDPAAVPALALSVPDATGPAVFKPDSSLSSTRLLGWSRDGLTFGYCEEVIDNDADEEQVYTACTFSPLAGGRDIWLTDKGKGSEPDPKKTAKMEAEIQKYGFSISSTWAYGADLILTYRCETLENGPVSQRCQAGAKVKGEKAVYPLSIEIQRHIPEEGAIESSDYILDDGVQMLISPAGKQVALFAEVWYMGASDPDLKWSFIDANKLAGQAYNVAGLAHHRKGAYNKALPLFQKAVMADSGGTWHYYNLACAYARLEKVKEVRAALEKAVAQNHPEVLQKLKTDADFDSIREQTWFQALVP